MTERRTVDTGDVKVLEARLDEVIRRLEELVSYHEDQDTKISQARGLAASLHDKIEARVRALEVGQARLMGYVALAFVLAVLAAKLLG